MKRVIKVVIAIATLSVLALAQGKPPEKAKAQESAMSKNHAKPTVAEAEKFMGETENKLNELSVKLARAQWVQATFITDDTGVLVPSASILRPKLDSLGKALQTESGRSGQSSGDLALDYE